MLDKVTEATFLGRLNETFVVQTETRATVELTLIQVTDLGEAERPEERAPFSILFRGPDQPVLPQRTYPFEHPDLGRFDLFIVPIGPATAPEKGMLYEAVFN